MKSKLRVLFVFASFLCVIAPLSISSGTIADAAKYLRVTITALMCFIALATGSFPKKWGASFPLLAFVFFFLLAAVWSDQPLWGLFHKGIFAIACLSGIALSFSVRNQTELIKGIRLLSVVSGISAFAVLAVYLKNPSGSMTHGRISVLGINANGIGGVASSLFLFCAHLAFHEKKFQAKAFAYLSIVAILSVVLASGSRASALICVWGFVCLGIPILKKPAKLIGVAVVSLGAILTFNTFFSGVGLTRLAGDLTKDTRSGIWKAAWRIFKDSPWIGHGWFSWGDSTSWGTFQSSFLQILVETGVMGVCVLCTCSLIVFVKMNSSYSKVRSSKSSSQMMWLAIACASTVFLRGFFESSMVTGASLDPLLLGLGVGLSDRIPQIAMLESKRRWQQQMQQITAQSDQDLSLENASP